MTKEEKIKKILKSDPDLEDTCPAGKNYAFLSMYGRCGHGMMSEMWSWNVDKVKNAPDNILDGILKRVS
jgi:hypothetical protein